MSSNLKVSAQLTQNYISLYMFYLKYNRFLSPGPKYLENDAYLNEVIVLVKTSESKAHFHIHAQQQRI